MANFEEFLKTNVLGFEKFNVFGFGDFFDCILYLVLSLFLAIFQTKLIFFDFGVLFPLSIFYDFCNIFHFGDFCRIFTIFSNVLQFFSISLKKYGDKKRLTDLKNHI